MQLLTFRLADPQNALDTYGAGALIRVERDTVSTFATASEITTIAIEAGKTEYEYRDQTGVAGTHWGRWRISEASPSTAADYSGYLGSYQYGASAGGVIALETAKLWTSISGTVDDGWLALGVAAMNRAIVRGIGVDLGPSPDTTRYYDGRSAVRHGTRLWIPGGIREFTTVAVTDDSGSNWTTITADVRIGPATHERPYGEPGSYVEFIGSPTTRSSFPTGTDDVRFTCTAFEGFGWDAWPDDLVQAGMAAMQRMAADRAGTGQYPTETDAMRYLNAKTLAYYRHLYFPMAGN